MIFIKVVLIAMGALFILKRYAPLRRLPITPHDYFQDLYMEHQAGLFHGLRYIHLFEPVGLQRAGLELATVLDLQDRIR